MTCFLKSSGYIYIFRFVPAGGGGDIIWKNGKKYDKMEKKRNGKRAKEGGGKGEKKRKITEGKNYDKIYYLRRGKRYSFPQYVRHLLGGKKYHFGGEGWGENMIFGENTYIPLICLLRYFCSLLIRVYEWEPKYSLR